MKKWCIIVLLLLSDASVNAAEVKLPIPGNLQVLSRQWRIDMHWEEPSQWSANEDWWYEVERSVSPDGPFEKCHEGYLGYPGYSDFFGEADKTYYYRVRTIWLIKERFEEKARIEQVSPDVLYVSPQDKVEKYLAGASRWSKPAAGTSQKLDKEKLLLEVQEASFRYFWNFAHPVSGVPRMQYPGWGREISATSAIGMGMFNIGVGVERGWITRQEAAKRVLKIVEFLDTKPQRYFGAYAHVINARTGETLPFSAKDDGADVLETAYMIQGLLFAREYFDGLNSMEKKLRKTIDKIWHEVDWTKFSKTRQDGTKVLMWHWSPNDGFEINLECIGFNECQIYYLLALSSPTHPVSDDHYWQGWQTGDTYGGRSTHFGLELPLQRIFYLPLFTSQYTYMGLDPKAMTYDSMTYDEIFRNWSLAQYRYARSRKDDFKGYDKLWGLTASINKVGYKAHAPVHNDDGTIAPTAALSAIAYVPDESKECMVEMFTQYGKQLWGAYGFFDAFNLTQDYFASHHYLSIDVGPVAPMIENHLTGKCWDVFMKAPELQATVKRLVKAEAERSKR
jgi:hypothetical protein